MVLAVSSLVFQAAKHIRRRSFGTLSDHCKSPVVPKELGKVLGFIGTGTITSAIVTGLCSLPLKGQACDILVSPRNATKAEDLERRFSGVKVTETNQELVDSCDTIFLALTPQRAQEVLTPLEFQSGKLIVSLMHGILPETVSKIISPAKCHVVRVNPLPGVAHHSGISVVCPPHPPVAALFRQLGRVYEVNELEQLHRFHAASALMGPFYELLRTSEEWLVESGVERPVAHKFIGDLFLSLAKDAHSSSKDYAGLVAEQTPGGLNENAIRELTRAGIYDAYSLALDGTLDRLKKLHNSR